MTQGAMRKVLIIDDSDAKRRLLNMILQRDFLVFEITNGPEALARIPDIQPDAILLDVELPKMASVGIYRHLKAHSSTAQIPVLLSAALRQDLFHGSGFELRAEDFIEWPVKAADLVARISARIESS